MTVDFLSLRRKMVDNQIRTVDVTDLDILAAFLHVPREEFIDQERRDFAYLDREIVLIPPHNGASARSLMCPAALARLLQLAQIEKAHKVLDVGATSGYASAILAKLATFVVALECDENLSQQAINVLSHQGVDNVEVVCGPLEKGHEKSAPYDVILCEGAVDFVPQALFTQLQENGRLVVVEGHGLSGIAKLYIKENGAFSVRSAFNLALAPLDGFQKEKGFVF